MVNLKFVQSCIAPIIFVVRKKPCQIHIRAYEFLVANDRLHEVRSLLSDLILIRYADKYTNIFPFFLQLEPYVRHLSVRQYMFKTIANYYFILSIYLSLAFGVQVIHPLPKAWIDLISSRNIPINRIACSLFWFFYTFFGFLRNIIKSFLFLIKIFFLIERPRVFINYAYFINIKAQNIPRSYADKPSVSNIFSWYLNSPFSDGTQVACIDFNSKSDFSDKALCPTCYFMPYELINSIDKYLELLRFFIFELSLDLLSFAKFNFFRPLLLHEILQAKATSLADHHLLAIDYIIPYSDDFFKPLWCYVVEKCNSRILVFFYSTFEEPHSKVSANISFSLFGLNTWTHLLVIDSYQSLKIKSNITSGICELKVVGAIPFFASQSSLPFLSERTIAVFDLQDLSFFDFMPFSTYGEYRRNNFTLYKDFFQQIIHAAVELGFHIAYKSKRTRLFPCQPHYISALNQFLGEASVTEIPCEISAVDLINVTKASISMCFTTTAVYKANHANTSVYFDPTGWIHPDDSAAHGVPILIGYHNLFSWLSQV